VEASVKERLTGALIFVAAVIVIVPEMFSGPEPQAVAVTTAQPAEAGPPLRTYSMTLNDSGEMHAAAPAPEAPPEAPAAAPPAVAAEPLPTEPAPAVAATVKPQVPEPVTSTAAGSWWLQVGIFASRANAERLAQKLRAAGFSVDLEQYTAGGKDMLRVRAGPVRDRAEALALQSRLAASGNASHLLPP
jgi:DedD protein